MSKIEIKEMTLTDFKGQKEKKITFGSRTIVSGKNGCGKTTLADAFLWVFCDKDYSLKKNPDIRPDDGRECLPRVDIELVIDGKPVSIAKFQKKSESKSGKISLSNNYEIDGDTVGWEKFKDSLKEMGFNFDRFLMLAHPDAFCEEKDKDAREILLSIPNKENESDLAIARITEGCSHLIPELEQHSAKKVETIYKEKVKGADSMLKSIPDKIETLEEQKVDYDTAELELQKNVLQEQIESLEKQISQSGDERATKLKDRIEELKISRSTLVSKLNAEVSDKKFKSELLIRQLESKRNFSVSNLNKKTDELEELEKELSEEKTTLENFQNQYLYVKDHKYNDELKKISKETFSDSQAVCPTCGQILPPEQIENLRAKFEEMKQKRINQLETKRKLELDSIAVSGNFSSKKKQNIKDQIEELKTLVSEIADELDELNACLVKEQKEFKQLPDKPDLSANPEYQSIQKEISEKEAELSSLDGGEEVKKQLTEQLKAKKDELAAVHQKIGEANNNIRIDESIAELQEKRKEYSQKSADAQMILDELKTLSMAKNKILEDAVNQYFSGVRVKLFDTQKNGEVVDACIWYVQDKDDNWKKLIGNANTALVTKGKIAIIDGLQKFYGLSYPVFVDYAAELDNDSLAGIKADMQLIFLKVAEGDMTVTEV